MKTAYLSIYTLTMNDIQKIDKVEKNLTGRIDKLGKSLAYLEDDAPTREEFDNLEDRVDKVE